MLDAETISLFFGAAAGVWATGFGFGKATAWVRALLSAA